MKPDKVLAVKNKTSEKKLKSSISISKEDYLRVIYDLIEESGFGDSEGIKPIEIAKRLGVTKPSVSQMIQKLTAERYILSKKYSTIILTSKGQKVAANLAKRHRIIEVFLKDVLKCPDDKIAIESHTLEHAFSDEMLSRIDRLLRYPKRSISGKKIPRF